MDDVALRALRFAATLVAVVPSVHLRLRVGERTVFRVARDVASGDDRSESQICHPDDFRAGIVYARRALRVGRPARVLGALTSDTVVEVGLLPGDVAGVGGISRFRAGGSHLHLFMTTIAPASCKRTLATSLGDDVAVEVPAAPASCQVWERIGLHFDPLTEVTVVHAFAPESDAVGAGAAMARMLEALVVAEALEELGAGVIEGPNEAHT